MAYIKCYRKCDLKLPNEGDAEGADQSTPRTVRSFFTFNMMYRPDTESDRKSSFAIKPNRSDLTPAIEAPRRALERGMPSDVQAPDDLLIARCRMEQILTTTYVTKLRSDVIYVPTYRGETESEYLHRCVERCLAAKRTRQRSTVAICDHAGIIQKAALVTQAKPHEIVACVIYGSSVMLNLTYDQNMCDGGARLARQTEHMHAVRMREQSAREDLLGCGECPGILTKMHHR